MSLLVVLVYSVSLTILGVRFTLALALPAGRIVDLVDRRRVLLLTQAASHDELGALVAAGLSLLAEPSPLPAPPG